MTKEQNKKKGSSSVFYKVHDEKLIECLESRSVCSEKLAKIFNERMGEVEKRCDIMWAENIMQKKDMVKILDTVEEYKKRREIPEDLLKSIKAIVQNHINNS